VCILFEIDSVYAIENKNERTKESKIKEVKMEAKKHAFDKRIESIGWALFLVMSGALLIAPEGLVPEGTWLLGMGLIILGSMGIRYLYGIRIDGFWTILGFLALGSGISEFFNLDLPVFPAILVIIGAVIVYKALTGKINLKEENWKCWR
jgi:hypothetical protein